MWEKLWKDPVWSKVIATGIIAAAGVVGAYLLGYWPAISGLVSTGWIFTFASSSVPNWVIALLGLGSVPSVILLVALAWQALRGGGASSPNWTSYTSDEFFGLRWRWHYAGGSIVRLHTFCPTCDYQVFARDASSYDFSARIRFSCDSCHRDLAEFSESEAQLNSKVERFIQQKVRNNTWRVVGAT